jgi:peptide-methionine (S)-S-oxide reductase
VQGTLDPESITYREILEIFFATHDPPTLARQGADVGTQYRSAIFTHSDEQAEVARKLVAELDTRGLWDDSIVTEIAPLDRFYPAERYHDEYYRRNPNQGYCRVVIGPKLAKFRKSFAHRLAEGP